MVTNLHGQLLGDRNRAPRLRNVSVVPLLDWISSSAIHTNKNIVGMFVVRECQLTDEFGVSRHFDGEQSSDENDGNAHENDQL